MAEGVFLRLGVCLKYLKREWDRKEWRRNRFWKGGGNLGQGVGVLKKRGGVLEPSYELKLISHSWYMKKFDPNFILKYMIHFWIELKKTQLIQIENFHDNLTKSIF